MLLIGDHHSPYHHIDYLDFLKAVNKKYNCKLQIHLGDEVDSHAISFHDSESELLSAGDELNAAIDSLVPWNKAFPKLKLLSSNHGSLIFRRLKSQGIPVTYIRPLKEIYNTPMWSWHDEIILRTNAGDVYLCHGKSGVYNKLAREIGCSAVQGHFHSKLEITWCNSVFNQRFSMFVGCGINIDSLAFAYGKNHIPTPMLGCGIIDAQGMPHIIKMNLTKSNRWNGLVS